MPRNGLTMLNLIAEQIPISPNPSQLKDFLQYGQMGLALAALIVGAFLFMTAIKQQNLSKTTGDLLRFFAKVMLALFVVSFLGEMATKSMDLYMKLHPADPQVNVTVEMPPLNEDNYKDYGLIKIKTIEVSTSGQATPVPADQPRTFLVRNGTHFHIDLGNLTTLLFQAQQRAIISRNESTKGDSTAGAGAPK
jgi:hypothetical protein